ncbi:MAG: chemotaxis protein MotB [Planctomycetota bacterium]|jgi:chemotaxis protein MotB
MKRNTFTRPILLVLGALMFSSCATQQQYKQAVDLAKHYQDELLALELDHARMKARNDRLTSELTNSQVNALEASSGEGDFEERLADYEKRLAGLSNNPGGITRIDLNDGAYVYMVPDAVLFKSGSSDVGEEGRKALINTVAADIKRGGHGRIWVRGHTDSVPVAKASTLKRFPHGNLQLSTSRAIEVAAILTGGGGVSKDQVVVAGFGPLDPLAANDTASNRALNRRVEIFVSPPK